MVTFRTILRTLANESVGAAAIEYALIASLISVAVLGGIIALGGGTTDMWTNIANTV